MTTITATRNAGPRRRFSGSSLPRMRRTNSAMGDMNVTPFIDVLLVLLIMIILAVPIKNHVAEVVLPAAPPITLLPIQETNAIVVDAADRLFWNGDPVTVQQLRAQVAAASALASEPVLRFEPDANASYDRAAQTIVLIKEEGATKFAFAGNARYRDFGL